MKKIIFLTICVFLAVFAIKSSEAGICGSNITCNCGDELNSSYLMSGNLYCNSNGLRIISDESTLDCAGYSISGVQNGNAGVLVINQSNVEIKNCEISNFSQGFILGFANNISIHNSTIKRNSYGIMLLSTILNSKFFSNLITDNSNGIAIRGGSSNNLLWNNYFIGNTNHVDPFSNGGSANWNLSNNGNYWDDFINNSGFPNIYRIRNGDIDYWPIYSNNPPVLMPIGNQTTNEMQRLDIQLNATDPENTTLIFNTDASQVLPSNFSFDSLTGLFSWTPGFEDSGEYFVNFSVTDGHYTDYEIVKIKVNDVRWANLVVNNIATPGTTINFSLSDPSSPGNYYYLLLSNSNSTGIRLTDNRTIGIDPDSLFWASIYQPISIGLAHTPFFLNNVGSSIVRWNIPSNIVPRDVDSYDNDVYAVFVTVDMSRPFPQSIKTISNVERIELN